MASAMGMPMLPSTASKSVPSDDADSAALAPLRGCLVLASGEAGEVVAYRLSDSSSPVMEQVDKLRGAQGSTAMEWIELHPSLPRVYAFSSFWKPMSKAKLREAHTGVLTVMTLDVASGTLARHATFDTLGRQPCEAACSPDGSQLAVAHYLDGRMTLFPLDSTGDPVTEGARVIPLPWKEGTRVADEDRLLDGFSGPLCHSARFSPSGHWVMMCDAGQGRLAVVSARANEDAIPMVVDVKPTVSAQTFFQSLLIRKFGYRPRHAAFHPSGRYVYVLFETVNCITAHAFNEETGTLSPAFQEVGCGAVNDTCCLCLAGLSMASEIAVSADGQALFASNRGLHSRSTLASFAISEDGKLEPKSQADALGKSPRHFVLHGGLLLAGLEHSGGLAVFDTRSGGDASLAPLAVLPLGAAMAKHGPMCVQLLPSCR